MKNNIKNKKSKNNILFWVGLIAFVAFFVFLTVETATSGASLAKLEQDEATLIQENRDLEDAVVTSSSLNGYEEKSQELGFVKPSKIFYINPSDVVAKLP